MDDARSAISIVSSGRNENDTSTETPRADPASKSRSPQISTSLEKPEQRLTALSNAEGLPHGEPEDEVGTRPDGHGEGLIRRLLSASLNIIAYTAKIVRGKRPAAAMDDARSATSIVGGGRNEKDTSTETPPADPASKSRLQHDSTSAGEPEPRLTGLSNAEDLPPGEPDYGTLVLWDERHSVSDGSLDKALAKSTNVRKSAITVLHAILSTVSRGAIGSVLYEQPAPRHIEKLDLSALLQESRVTLYSADYIENEEPSSDENEDRSVVDERDALGSQLRDLGSYTRCLNDLDSSLTNPVTDAGPGMRVDMAECTSLAPHHSYSIRIRDRFPKVSRRLADHLGEANLRRYQFISRMRLEAANAENGQDLPLNIAGDMRAAGKPLSSRLDAATLPDSGIGTSIQTSTVYALSQASSFVSAMGDKPESVFPPLSKNAKSGKPFECDACGRLVVATRSRVWKKHLLEDLQPYICILPECSHSQTPLPDRMAWIKHVQVQHATAGFVGSSTCPFCKHSMPDETWRLLTHIAKHLEVISAIVLPRNDPDCNALSEESSHASESSLFAGNANENLASTSSQYGAFRPSTPPRPEPNIPSENPPLRTRSLSHETQQNPTLPASQTGLNLKVHSRLDVGDGPGPVQVGAVPSWASAHKSRSTLFCANATKDPSMPA
ncbi:hypothetical protein DL770_008233 [Monosporascus sp. CRB-9-2]|nr:hypothetical protein DL770_008233 [Monosporascus sp. CRB-9-2]